MREASGHLSRTEEDETDLDEVAEEILDDDQDELLEAEDGLDWEALWDEIRYLEEFLKGLRSLGTDPKLRRVLDDLTELRSDHSQAVIFTQYTDTMDFLRDSLVHAFGSTVACYSGRGGEVWDPVSKKWCLSSKDEIKEGFRERNYWALVCTEAASEGLNLQSADLLINYDMPWNPMRVEQRIGRIDRIGQPSKVVRVVNYYYANSVEADVYTALSDRLQVFRTAVGPHQAVLGRIAKRIERAAMARPERREEAVRQEIEQIDTDWRQTTQEGVNVDDLAEADVAPMGPLVPPCGSEDISSLFKSSEILAGHWQLREVESGLYELLPKRDTEARRCLATFRQDILDSRPEHVKHCLAWGDHHFTEMLDVVPAPRSDEWGALRRVRLADGEVEYRWQKIGAECPVQTLADLREVLQELRTIR